ncbi:MAG: hypothetical protein ACRENE_11640 [Polyangiaceae bacterium]
MNMNPPEASHDEPHAARLRTAPIESLKALRSLPKRLKTSAEENPRAALFAVGAAGFVIGGLLGSRLGRFAIAASIPVVVSRILDGSLAREMTRFATGLAEAPHIEH